MEPLASNALLEGLLGPKTNTTKTSLYRLIEAVQEEVSPGDDALVVAVVSHLLSTGRIRVPLSSEFGEDYSGEDYSNAGMLAT